MTTITISGFPGSGKTTVSEILKEKIGLNYIYSGDIFRNKAQEYKMSLEEFGKYCEKNPEIDRELDDFQLKILKKGDVIVEGRIAGWIAYKNNIPSVKILLTADLQTRAERIVKRERGDINYRKKEILKREKSENLRYKKYYDIDMNETSIYDLIIDTSNKTPEEIVNIILNKIKK